jgi:hypothetical protein
MRRVLARICSSAESVASSKSAMSPDWPSISMLIALVMPISWSTLCRACGGLRAQHTSTALMRNDGRAALTHFVKLLVLCLHRHLLLGQQLSARAGERS